jgi:hypothetical protein
MTKSSLRLNVKVFFEPTLEPAGKIREVIVLGAVAVAR